MTDDELKRVRFEHAVLAGSRLRHDLLAKERSLMDSKWPGYFWLTPWEATKRFYDLYIQRERRYVEQHVDLYLAKGLIRRPLHTIPTGRDFTSIWTARQRADELPVPYEVYLDFSMDFWSRRRGPGRDQAPRINQLGPTDKKSDAWHSMFLGHAEDAVPIYRVQFATDVACHMADYRGTEEQRIVRDTILEWCANSTHSWEDSLHRWIYETHILKPLHFRKLVGIDLLRQAKDSAPASPSLISRSGGNWTSLPSCHGLPKARDMDSPRCRKCAAAETCDRVAGLVKRAINLELGDEDPVLERARELTRRRKARCIAKKKLAAHSAVAPAPESLNAGP